jgi:hypothetical protein
MTSLAGEQREQARRASAPRSRWLALALVPLLLTACAHTTERSFEFGTHRLGRLECVPDASQVWSCTSGLIDVVALASTPPGRQLRRVVVTRASFLVNRDDPEADSWGNLPTATVGARIALRPADAPDDGSGDLLLGTLSDVILRKHQVDTQGQATPRTPIEPLGPIRIVATGTVTGPAKTLFLDVFCEAQAVSSK